MSFAVGPCRLGGAGLRLGPQHFQIEALLNWIEGTGEPFVTGPDARRPVEVNLAIYTSQRTGEKVRLPLDPGAEVGF